MTTHIQVRNESIDRSIQVNARYRTIYVLRSRCEKHELDKLDSFYLFPNVTKDEMTRQMRTAVRRAFRQKYRCNDKIKFDLEADEQYRWDTKLNTAVEIKT